MPDGGRWAAVPAAPIRVATVDDSGIVTELLTGAYNSDPVLLWVAADPAHPARQPRFDAIVAGAFAAAGVIVHLAADGNGCAVWYDHRAGWHEVVGYGIELLSKDSPPFSRRYDLLREMLRDCHPESSHWHLGYLAVKLDHGHVADALLAYQHERTGPGVAEYAVAATAEDVRRLTAMGYWVGPQPDAAQPPPIRPAWRRARSAPTSQPADARARQGFAPPGPRRPTGDG